MRIRGSQRPRRPAKAERAAAAVVEAPAQVDGAVAVAMAAVKAAVKVAAAMVAAKAAVA